MGTAKPLTRGAKGQHPMDDLCRYCGHSIADDHDELGLCQGQSYLGGDPPVYKSCSCNPNNLPNR